MALVSAAALAQPSVALAQAAAPADSPPSPPNGASPSNPAPPASPGADATSGAASPKEGEVTTEETTQTESQEEVKSEPPEEDDKVGFKWVWLVPEVGYSTVNLTSFSESNLAVVDNSESGLMVGAGAGVRLVFLTLGVRARHHFAMKMWQVMGEVGFHFKVNRVDPYIAIRGGYDTVGSLSAAVSNASGGSSTSSVDVSVKGFNVGPAIGLDYFVAQNVTLGIEGSGDFLFLNRPTATLPSGLTAQQQATIKQSPLYQASGSAVGFGGLVSLRLGFHF